jgi:hypothetical protein
MPRGINPFDAVIQQKFHTHELYVGGFTVGEVLNLGHFRLSKQGMPQMLKFG